MAQVRAFYKYGSKTTSEQQRQSESQRQKQHNKKSKLKPGQKHYPKNKVDQSNTEILQKKHQLDESNIVRKKIDAHASRADNVSRSQCCYFDASRQYCNAYQRVCRSAVYCDRYRVSSTDKSSLFECNPVGSNMLFIPSGTMDDMIIAYQKQEHPCPVCRQNITGEWTQRGQHHMAGICSCPNGHEHYIRASFETMDDDTFVRQEFWQLSYKLFADYYSSFMTGNDTSKLKQRWDQKMKNKVKR